MANEITYTGSGANTRAAEVFNRLIWETIVDRTDLRSRCTFMGDLGGSGSDTLVTGTIAWDDAMAAANVDEVTAAGNTALGNGAISLVVAQQIISYSMSDKESITGADGQLSLEMIAGRVADSYILRATDLICALFTSFSAIVSDTGVNMTTDHFYSAIYTLEQASVQGPFTCVLYTVQYTDLQDSIRGEGGPAQFIQNTQDQLVVKAPGYKGMFAGVDIIACDSVGTDGPDSNGAMWGAGAIGYVEASARRSMPGAIAAASGSPVYAEYVRQGDPGLSSVVAHAFCGYGINENARGVEIKTDR